MSNRVIAVLVSDLHFSHTPPVARSAEPSWYAAMLRQWKQLQRSCNENQAPLIVAGDVFDRWTCPPELIGFVIDLFKMIDSVVYIIPGQHDLPAHAYSERHRAAYGVLLRACEHVRDLENGFPLRFADGWYAHGFPWGSDLVASSLRSEPGCKNLAVVHKYIWARDCGYHGAAEGDRVNSEKLSKFFSSFDSVVVGDNHKGFLQGSVLNNGGFMRRKIDEIDYAPGFGFLFENGEIERQFFDCSSDVFIEPEKYLTIDRRGIDFEDYVATLKSLSIESMDFHAEVRRRLIMMNASPGVVSEVEKVLS